MKITEEELIDILKEYREKSQRCILDAHQRMLPANSYGLGYEAGMRDACDLILQHIVN